MPEETDILDPAHDPNAENVGAAGIAKPEEKDELKLSEDGNLAEHKGVKYIRQEALHAERQRNKELSDTLSKLDPYLGEFEEFLKQKGSRLSSTVERTAAHTRTEDSDYSDDEL